MDDYTLWDVDEIVSAYSEIPEWQVRTEEGFRYLFKFLQDNGLVSYDLVNDELSFIKRTIKISEVTDEGRKLVSGAKSPYLRWIKSKARDSVPPNMKILEKALMEIRSTN
ncbi:hypothetical protein [Pseudomonas sichuanensis]|uniref:hypothetical protein n=1 Tax=Pseudomonas sichuanensis TaxID=2213015 RepID=UPI002AB8DB08|nr:hypothetical protein [Pseudomonas sichuanensis]MDZ4016958.1 hypothetical protein [Pseudomonas sichuanensis]